jgi:hypothetical protein
MDRDDRTEGTGRTAADATRRGRGACLVDGCPCKDARIVSHRRARFFSDLARTKGETALRVIAPEPGWTVPGLA